MHDILLMYPALLLTLIAAASTHLPDPIYKGETISDIEVFILFIDASLLFPDSRSSCPFQLHLQENFFFTSY